MRPQTRSSVIRVLVVVALLVLVSALPPVRAADAADAALPLAAQPANDNFANALNIASVPFYYEKDVSEATFEPGEPALSSCIGSARGTVWFTFTPASDGWIVASISGWVFDIEVFTGSAIDDLTLAFPSCGSTIAFQAVASTQYYIRVAVGDWITGDLGLSLGPPAPLSLSAGTWDYPLVRGKPISFYGEVRDTGSIPVGPCSWEFGDGTPAESTCDNVTHTYQTSGPFQVTFSATTIDGRSGDTTVEVTVREPLPPKAMFDFWPSYPSTNDQISFYNNSEDPDGWGFASALWEFGDGSTSTDFWAYHRYEEPNVYDVTLTVTTHDGRSNSVTRQVEVRDRDVSIMKLSVPQAARAGQSRELVVAVSSNLSAEYVRVSLFQSVPGGTAFVGSYAQAVPVRSARRTTSFSFNYTFTAEDAQVGKVTFRAVAEIFTGPNGYQLNDIFPADNERISTVVKVNR